MPQGLLAFPTSCPRGPGARWGVADGEGAGCLVFLPVPTFKQKEELVV